MNYVEPSFKVSAFNCPLCNAYANMHWILMLVIGESSQASVGSIFRAKCNHCRRASIWRCISIKVDKNRNIEDQGILLYPASSSAPLPHPDMPDDIKEDYIEAQNISSLSHRGAAALLRLVIQKLCKHLGEKGKNINIDIGNMIKKGLPVEIQQALDVVRVVGNNAVHPGELSSDDVAGVATTLFELVNFIVEDRISRPKKLNDLYQNLPEGALNGIQNRDNKN